ncbi:MAG: ComEC/Rec2 family competence protein [Eubacteriales bacterium]
MKLIKDFPTVAMFFSFFVMSCVFSYFSLLMKIIAAALLFSALIFVIIDPTHGRLISHELRHGLILSLSASILAAVISIFAFNIYADSFDSYDGKNDYVTLKITECDYSLVYTSRYQAEVLESSLLPRGTKVLINTPLGSMSEGSVISGDVTYTSLKNYLGSFDAERYYNPKKIMIVCDGEDMAFVRTQRSFSLSSVFSRINKKLNAMITAHTNHDSGGLASAVILGNRDNLSDIDRRDFRRIGVSHLLVVSGTHFAVIVTFAENALKRLKVRRKVRSFINIGVIILFMALTGMSPTVVRAGIMHIFAQLSIIISRKANTLNSFAISGCILILFNPLCAVDCGLQMSFAATYSCIMSKRVIGSILKTLRNNLKFRLRRRRKLYKAIMSFSETVLMTCYVNLIMLPLTWLYFGEVSLLSIPSNLIFIPLVTVLMYIVVFYLLLYPIRLFIVPLASLINVFCSFMTGIADFFARLEGVVVSINYSFSIFFLIPLTLLLLAIPLSSAEKRARLMASSAVVILVFAVTIGAVKSADRQNTYITYTAKGKNDGFALKSDGKLLLCEISDASYGFMYNLTDAMAELHCSEIDALLITHYHNKHLQLVSRLCENEILKNLILTEPINEKEQSVYTSLLLTAEEYSVDVSVYGAGELITFGDSEINLFERKYVSRSTHPITAMTISAFGEEVFIASESFNEMPDEVIAAAESAEYLILGRHSPVYKKTFGLTLDKPKVIAVSSNAYAFSDENLKKYFDENSAAIDADKLEIRLKQREP